MTFRRTVAAALAATAIAAPAASAQPADIHAPLATAHQQRQDLRSPDAIDAARAQRKDLRSPDALDAALRRGRSAIAVVSSPGHPSEAAHTTPLPPQTTEALADSGGGIDWATVALGSAALMLFLGGVVALMTRTRPTSGPRVSV